MHTKIYRRFLTDKEVSLINADIRLYQDLTYVSPVLWKTFSEHFVLYANREFAGVCATIKLNSWVKIGPFAMRAKFINKGLGTKLLASIVRSYPKNNLYIGSSNPSLESVVIKYGFTKTKSFSSLPKEIRTYLSTTFLRFLNLTFLIEGIRKLFRYGKRPYTFYLRQLVEA